MRGGFGGGSKDRGRYGFSLAFIRTSLGSCVMLKLVSIVANTALKAACLVSPEMGISSLRMASRKLIRAGVVPANFSMTETILVTRKLAYAKEVKYCTYSFSLRGVRMVAKAGPSST